MQEKIKKQFKNNSADSKLIDALNEKRKQIEKAMRKKVMEQKNKTQNGFIQIPLLIAIIVSIIGASVATTGAILHKQGKSIPFIASISQVFKGTEDVKPEIKSEQLQPQVEQSLPKETSQEGNSQAEQELKETKLEAEKAKQETEKVKAENERLKAQQEIKVIEKAKQEAQKIIESEQRVAEISTTKQCSPEYFCANQCWGQCPTGQKPYCSSGSLYCCSSDNLFCNNKCWTPCPVGQEFQCPSTGNAYCALSQEELKKQQEAQTQKELEKKQAEAEALKKTQEEAKIKAEQELQRQLEAKRLVEEQQKQAQQNVIKNTDQQLSQLISTTRPIINTLSQKKDDVNAFITFIRSEMNKYPASPSVQQSGQQLLSEYDNSSFLLGKLIGIVNDQIVEISSLFGSGKAPSNGLWLQYDSYFSQYGVSNNKITSLMKTFVDSQKATLEELQQKEKAKIDLGNQILQISQQIANKEQEIQALPGKVAQEVYNKVNGFEITQSQVDRLVATELAKRLPQLETELQNLYSQKQQLVIKYNLLVGAGL